MQIRGISYPHILLLTNWVMFLMQQWKISEVVVLFLLIQFLLMKQ